MFYFESDELKIQSWIRKGDAELKKTLENFVTSQQLSQYDAEFKSQIDIYLKGEVSTLRREITALKMSIVSSSEFDNVKRELATLKNEVSALRQAVDSLKAPTPAPEVDTLKNEVSALRQAVDALKAPTPAPEVDTLKNEVSALRQAVDALKAPTPAPEVDTLKNEVSALRKAVDALKAPTPAPEVDTLKNEVSALRKAVDALKAPTPAQSVERLIESPPIEEKFFLPEQQGIFLNNERTKISAQIKQALNVSGIEKYLLSNPSDTSKKFQRLLSNHLREVKKFADKLKLTSLENNELSETVTAKYFKLFQRTIFDNMLVGIRRGLKDSEEFYSGLLDEVNKYLSGCGIYSVNLKSGKKVETEDYENTKPQIVETDDKTLSETINEVERLPYRINYLDKFGEQKFLQYAGVASIYKAV